MAESFNLRIADCIIKVLPNYDYSKLLCYRYLTDAPAELQISITQSDINKERVAQKDILGKTHFPDHKLEYLSLHRQLCERLIDSGVFGIHGAAISLNNEAFLFVGFSGVGKTTHIYHWLDACPNAIIINGDKPFIKANEDGAVPIVFGSPWAGKENMSVAIGAPLKSIIVMERADYNRMQQISFKEIFIHLYGQVFRPENEDKARKTLQMLKSMDNRVSFFRFQCNNFKDDCFGVAYNALVGKQP